MISRSPWWWGAPPNGADGIVYLNTVWPGRSRLLGECLGVRRVGGRRDSVSCWFYDFEIAHDFLLIPRIYAFLILSSCEPMFVTAKFERITTLPRRPSFSRYLRDARTKRGLSVAEVAEQVGVSRQASIFGKTITLDHEMRT